MAETTPQNGDVPPSVAPISADPENSAATAASAVGAANDETVIGLPPQREELGPAGTAVMPAITDDEPRRWSARASVPPPSADALEAVEIWEDHRDHERRSALLPLLMTGVVLVMLTVLAFGAWLVLSAEPDPSPPAPPPATSASTTSRPPAPTTTRSSPTPTTPAAVSVPELRGVPFAQAAERLEGLGFNVVRVPETSAEIPPGRVVRTEPGSGSEVAPGSTIQVVVSTPTPTPTSSQPAPTRTATATPTNDPDDD